MVRCFRWWILVRSVRLTKSGCFANVRAGHEGINHEGYGAFVVFYLWKGKSEAVIVTPFQKKLLAGLLIMALISPLGILIPKKFNAGDAWGEWDTGKIERLIGYVPAGMKKIAGIWKAPVRDYSFGGDNASLAAQALYYIISGFLGIIVAASVIYLISRFLVKNGK